MRWRIIRTLLWKELLRFRYNWGLLVMLGAVLALSALISLGDRMGELPGQSSRVVKICVIWFDNNNPNARKWHEALMSQPPEWFTDKNRIPFFRNQDNLWQKQRGLVYPDDYLFINLAPPWNPASKEPWQITYDYPITSQGEAILYRFWVNQVTGRLLDQDRLQEKLPEFSESQKQTGAEDRLPKILTALVIFSFYLLSFNLYITSTAEEREKKAMLALMLSPARPSEVIGAKVIFYALASMLMAAGVVALFDPRMLAKPFLWTSILAGSVSYVSIGTVVLCIVRRQSTINTVSMMYLIVTALVMSLSVFLLPFLILRFAMIENYLFHQLEMVLGEKPNPAARIYQPVMLGLTVAWFFVAVFVFSRRGMTIAHAKR